MPTISVDRTSQRFYSTPQPEPDVTVIHTTEGMSWPGYSGGGTAPHATIEAIPGKGIKVREHIDFTNFAKALMNLSGGVETNRRGALQFELKGTCDPKHKGERGWFYWPDADDVVLQALADYLRPIHARFGIPAVAPKFLPYPSSYGSKGGQRMSGATWVKFQGICGHQHVPENTHGDPGDFPIAKLLKFLGGTATSAPSKPASAVPTVLQKPAAVPTFLGVTRRGSTGTAVRRVQQRLKDRGWKITVDADFGPGTEAVVRAFQKEKGLTVDGVVGRATWAALWKSAVT